MKTTLILLICASVFLVYSLPASACGGTKGHDDKKVEEEA